LLSNQKRLRKYAMNRNFLQLNHQNQKTRIENDFSFSIHRLDSFKLFCSIFVTGDKFDIVFRCGSKLAHLWSYCNCDW